MAVVGAHAERVAGRVVAIDVRRVVLSILLMPFLVLGLVARYSVRAVVWMFGWIWYSLVEGWQMAAPKGAGT